MRPLALGHCPGCEKHREAFLFYGRKTDLLLLLLVSRIYSVADELTYYRSVQLLLARDDAMDVSRGNCQCIIAQ